jgi:pimeloyl-ACP methyl ester carboxylesterase
VSNSVGMPDTEFTWSLETVRIHGHEVAYCSAGSDGPAVVLLHGLAGCSAGWQGLARHLGDRYRLIAPDLLGHGQTAKPRGDYSVGAHATGVRDLLDVLGVERATLVGHSFGGGVAMQLAYLCPERAERLVLVASGGLGDEVSPLLRALSLPLSEFVLPLVMISGLRDVAGAIRACLGRIGLRTDPVLEEVLATYGRLTNREAQRAFVETVRASIDWNGQRASARDRLRLASELPTLIVWGAHDRVIPVEHARATHAAIPGSRLEVFEDSGHFLPLEHPGRLARLLDEFMTSTEAAVYDRNRWRELLTGEVVSAAG